MKIKSILVVIGMVFMCNLSLSRAQTCCGGQPISPPNQCCAGVSFDPTQPGTTASTSIDLSAYANMAKTIEAGAAAFVGNGGYTPPGDLSITYTATANSQCCSGAVQTVYVPSGNISLALGSVTGNVPIWPNVPYLSQGGITVSLSASASGTFKPCTPPNCSTPNTPAEGDISISGSGQAGVYYSALLNAISATATAGPTVTGTGTYCQGGTATWSGSVAITGTIQITLLGLTNVNYTASTDPWTFASS